MMQKYILIREYPGSPELGTISSEDTLIHKNHTRHCFEDRYYIEQSIIESNPEFWVPLKFKINDEVELIKESLCTIEVIKCNIVTINANASDYKLKNELPSDFNDYQLQMHNNTLINLSNKYIQKFIVLDVLLNLRDEYNLRDKNTRMKYIIYRSDNEIETSRTAFDTCIFSFNTAANRDLFLKNFKPQLEQIKDLI